MKTTTTTTTTTTNLSANSSPLKIIQQQGALTPLQEAQNSITLQVSTNLSPSSQEQRLPSVQSSVTLASNASSTTTIAGSPGTKIYVHQNNSPMRSVITFENGSGSASTTTTTTTTPAKSSNTEKEEKQETQEKKEKEIISEKAYSNKVQDETKHLLKQNKAERPSSLYANGGTTDNKENKPKQQLCKQLEEPDSLKLKLTNNRLNNSQAHLGDQGSLTKETYDAMNNSRKLSLSLSKDALSYRNLLRPTGGSKNNLVASNPPSPTKSYDNFGGSFNNVYIENLDYAKQRLASAQGSEPNLIKDKVVSSSGGVGTRHHELYSYPSLSDMQVQFTSLAAQKILKGCPLNSVDTLVEVNMQAAHMQEKPNNCDLTVHTDFGLV